MTAEIAIANKSAIVVAADSAVTVGKRKVHRNANKIFSICDSAPLGLMVYGYAEYCGIPWEIIAKLFREQHRSTTFRTANDCFRAFRQYLADPKYFSQEAEKINLLLFSSDVIGDLATQVKRITEQIKKSPKTVVPKILPRLIRQRIDTFDSQNSQRRLEFSLPKLPKFRRECSDFIRAATEDAFSSLNYKIPKKIHPKIVELVWHALASVHTSEYCSGVVIFGYGADEILPAIVCHEFDGGCCGSLRSIDMKLTGITRENEASIVPFANREVMDVFMEGITRKTRTFLDNLTEKCLQEVSERVVKSNFTLTGGQLAVVNKINAKAISEVMKGFRKSVRDWISEISVDPVMEVVKSLPKEDMAALAEALVEVTAHKTKVSSEIESVGGAVDVCVVTKGDGLIWIKRKHYFDIQKNHQYLYRRFGTIIPKATP